MTLVETIQELERRQARAAARRELYRESRSWPAFADRVTVGPHPGVFAVPVEDRAS